MKTAEKKLEKMRAKIILPNKKKINQAEKELFQKLKHRLINRRIAAAILGAILVCALLAGVYTILVLPKEPIPFDPQKMEVEIVGEDAYLSYAGSDSAGSVFCNPVTVGEGAEKKGNCNGLFKSKPVVHIYTTSFARAERR